MTVVVGFVGSDGAVMASDSEATESGHTRYDVDKIWTAGSLVLGYTGCDALRQPLIKAIDKVIKETFGEDQEIDRWQGRSALENAIKPVLLHAYSMYVGPRNEAGLPAGLDGALLVLGRDADGYWLLEIDGHNRCSFYTDRGFHTVGSGSAAAYVAQSLMKDYDAAGRPTAQLKLIAHRIVQTCIDTMGGEFGVGGHVELWYSENNGAFVETPTDECESIANAVEEWRGIERESLNQVVIGELTPQTVPEVALPEALEEDEGEGAQGEQDRDSAAA